MELMSPSSLDLLQKPVGPLPYGYATSRGDGGGSCNPLIPNGKIYGVAVLCASRIMNSSEGEMVSPPGSGTRGTSWGQAFFNNYECEVYYGTGTSS